MELLYESYLFHRYMHCNVVSAAFTYLIWHYIYVYHRAQVLISWYWIISITVAFFVLIYFHNRYRITEGVNLPFRVLPTIKELGRTRIEVNVKVCC